MIWPATVFGKTSSVFPVTCLMRQHSLTRSRWMREFLYQDKGFAKMTQGLRESEHVGWSSNLSLCDTKIDVLYSTNSSIL